MRDQNMFLKKIMAMATALMFLAIAATARVMAADTRVVLTMAQIPQSQARAYRLVQQASPTTINPIVTPVVMEDPTPEQIEAAVEEYFASIGSLNVQRYVNNFAPDGVLEDPVGTQPLQGTQAIAAYFAAIITPFSEIKPTVQEVIVCGHEAAVNWKLRLKTTTGKIIVIDGMGVFNFNQAGKLQSVREFWDLAAFLAQLQG